uniref:NADH dehydrogenase subunit 4 n=1 Tax=Auricularia heimuer TaxID=1579977 RepID=A0A8A2Z011_9AGAM|nr:NADH dehydrogenase subunit 4 [Auricularia heimuer]QSX43106.1 NADH dehydrogenase subunit 4 [Auricularia heimuer]
MIFKKKIFIMILSLLIIPLIGVLMLIPLGSSSSTYSGSILGSVFSSGTTVNSNTSSSNSKYSDVNSKELMKKIALFVSLLNLLVSIYMWFQFDNNSANYQFVYEFNSLNFCHFHVGIDGISLYFVVRPLTVNTNLELSRFMLLFLNFLFIFYITLPASRLTGILSTCWKYARNIKILLRKNFTTKIEPVPLRTVTELALRKPNNLPAVEMTRGPEHVIKVLKDVKYKNLRGKVLFTHVQFIMPSQNYNLALKILVTKCNHNYVEKQTALLSSWLLIREKSLRQCAKGRISDSFIGTGDPLNLETGINTEAQSEKIINFLPLESSRKIFTLDGFAYFSQPLGLKGKGWCKNIKLLANKTPKGDGVIVVPSVIRREGSQETVISNFRAGEGNTLHSIWKRSKTNGYNPYDSIHLNTKNTRVRNYATSPVVPVKFYTNADTQKLLIIKENAGKSGVYRWVNQVNGKTYIGSSVNLSTRFRQYYNIKYLLQYKMPIYKALLKHGHSNFSLEVLEYCEQAQCMEREQYSIDLLKPDYNILQTAGSLLGFKHSKESLSKISRALTGEKNPMYGKIGENSPLYGRKLSEQTRDKLSIAFKGENNPRFGKKKPEGSGSPSIKIKVLDILTGVSTIYTSMSEAAKALNCPSSSISGYFFRKRQTPFKKRFLLEKL